MSISKNIPDPLMSIAMLQQRELFKAGHVSELGLLESTFQASNQTKSNLIVFSKFATVVQTLNKKFWTVSSLEENVLLRLLFSLPGMFSFVSCVIT